MKSSEYRFNVLWGDTDAAGIVFYPNFYKWMNDSTHKLFRDVGYSQSILLSEDKLGIPLLEAKCEFKAALFFEDSITVHSTIKEIRNKVIVIDHVFYRDGAEIAKGYEIRAWTSFDGKPKAVPVPDYIREAFSE